MTNKPEQHLGWKETGENSFIKYLGDNQFLALHIAYADEVTITEAWINLDVVTVSELTDYAQYRGYSDFLSFMQDFKENWKDIIIETIAEKSDRYVLESASKEEAIAYLKHQYNLDYPMDYFDEIGC